MEITFTHPIYLWALIGIPLFIIAYIYNVRYKKRQALKFSNFEALSRVFNQPSLFPHQAVAFIANILVFTFLVFAAAGSTVYYQGESSAVDYVLAIDSSASMTAEDIAPTRLAATKTAASQFIVELGEDSKVLILSFAGTPIIEHDCCFLIDRTQALSSIDGIDILQAGGTDIGAAIITSTNLLIPEGRAKNIILVTDGRDTVGIPVDFATDYARENKITINTIALGTPEGGNAQGVISRPDTETLQQIAETTGGEFYEAQSAAQLESAYTQIANSRLNQIKIELGPLLLAMMLGLLILRWLASFTSYVTLP